MEEINERKYTLPTASLMYPISETSRSEILRTMTTHVLGSSSAYIKHPTTYLETLMNMIRIYMGTGMFAMGFAYKHTGWGLGIVLTIVMFVAVLYSNHILVNCSDELIKNRGLVGPLDMPNVVYYSFEEGPNCCTALSGCMKNLTLVNIVVLQLGVASVYIVFTAVSYKTVFESLVDFKMDVRVYMSIVFIPMLLMSLIKELKYLAPVSFFANIVLCSATIIIFVILTQNVPSITNRKVIASVDCIPMFFGTCLFALSGICLILPLRNGMKNPNNFNAWYGVLNASTLINGCFVISLGVLSYLQFGEDVKGSVTLNLPTDAWYSLVVGGAVGTAVMCSYALNFYAANALIWGEINARVIKIENDCIAAIFTITMALFTLSVAIGLPRLGSIISLFGALSVSLQVFCFPQLCDLVLRSSTTYGVLKWRFICNILLILLGFIVMISGVRVSINSFTKPET